MSMEAVSASSSIEGLTWQEARELLRTWREDGVRRSAQTVQLGQMIIKKASSLGNELWDIHEQVLIAALDSQNIECAKLSLDVLSRQFPGSLRVKRLEGMLLEATQKFDEALALYDKTLEDHPSCAAVWKRKVAILKANSSINDAIQELTDFLKVFMADKEAWLELADLYIQVNNYQKAAFCMEELILFNPHHHLYHQRYAEVCFSMGTPDAMELARKHFATALQLNPDNVRALYGFCWVSHVTNSQKKSAEVKSRNSRNIDWARTQLKLKYQNGNGQLRIVEKMLDSLNR